MLRLYHAGLVSLVVTIGSFAWAAVSSAEPNDTPKAQCEQKCDADWAVCRDIWDGAVIKKNRESGRRRCNNAHNTCLAGCGAQSPH
jgi:hypothetical protein